MKRSLRVALVTGMVFLSSCGSQPAAADVGTGYRPGYSPTKVTEGPRKPRAPRRPAVRGVGIRSAPQVREKAAGHIHRPIAKPAAKKVTAPLPSGSVASRIYAAWPGSNKSEAVAVAKCESNLNPSARSSSGRYLGLFQADSSFRRAYGYGPSVEQQTMMAWRGYKARGWQPWPNCGARRFGSR